MSIMESSPYKFSNFSIDSLISPRNFPNLSPFLNLNPWLFPTSSGGGSPPASASYYGLTPTQFQQLQLHHTAAGLLSSQLQSSVSGVAGCPEDLSRYSSSFPSGDPSKRSTFTTTNSENHEYEHGSKLNLLVNQPRHHQMLSLEKASERFRLSHHSHHHGIQSIMDSPPTSPGHLGSGKSHSFVSDSHSHSPLPLSGTYTAFMPKFVLQGLTDVF